MIMVSENVYMQYAELKQLVVLYVTCDIKITKEWSDYYYNL